MAPDFLFSFYYRGMLAAPLLAAARHGALNMHGSLLPRYRGRAPVNWAVLHGERETGATLHYMTAKPDAGDIVAQTRVPILPDDTARDVFDKVTVAAELTLDGVLPALIDGTAPRRPQDPASGSYFGGRRPEDGIIDWQRDAASIHNLVRAVAPPYPGARTTLAGVPVRVLRTRMADPVALPTSQRHSSKRAMVASLRAAAAAERSPCSRSSLPARPATRDAFVARFGRAPVPVGADPVAGGGHV